ncbi:hypothetical protein PSEUDO8AS_30296 [Pseudomonas sp. 8AS]|nr:hypothetical protein PSEUDO8AS_30296 [Pseudomonas sp. 8AS]
MAHPAACLSWQAGAEPINRESGGE